MNIVRIDENIQVENDSTCSCLIRKTLPHPFASVPLLSLYCLSVPFPDLLADVSAYAFIMGCDLLAVVRCRSVYRIDRRDV